MPASQAPTLFEAGSNWYLRGDLGVSFAEAPTISLSSISAPPPGLVATPYTTPAGTNWSTTNFTGGLGAGYRFNDYLRFDATWDCRTGPGGTRQTTLICPYAPTTGVHSQTTGLPAGNLYNTSDICNGTTNIKQYNNAFSPTPMSTSAPTASLRPTSAWRRPQHERPAGRLQRRPPTVRPTRRPHASGGFPQIWVNPQGQPISPQPAIAFGQQYWSRSISSTTYTFAWALSAGFGFQLNPSATFDIGYRYLNSGETPGSSTRKRV